MKVAILVHSDPGAGEEALGRVFNALAAAFDFAQAEQEVKVLFLGTGTRWISELVNPEHPINGLYDLVKDKIIGASKGCADVFGASKTLEQSSTPFLTENAVPGTAGLPSVVGLMADGYTILTY